MDRTKLLLESGFIKKNKEKYQKNPTTGLYEPVAGYKYDEADADEEERQPTFHQDLNNGIQVGFERTGFPTPVKTYNLSLEVFDLSLEEPYFWMVEYLRQNYSKVDKLEDSFAAAENSAFFGITQQRLGAQQDKISQFLATTGKMIKELFQMVRELRILDERLAYYDEAEEETKKQIAIRSKSAEITLKGLFIDLVQGGGKSAASVYGMSRELEFITLPDIFFDAPPMKDGAELDKYVEGLRSNFNENVLRVLMRHLRQYQEWRKRTHQEHKNRKRFMLSYLKQHYEIINMYLTWVKPYLRHVEKLSVKEKNMKSADIISSFEGSMLDIELLGQHERNLTSNIKGYECVLVTFHYRTRPEMKVVQEGYQRGPVHIGRYEMNIRVYHWLKDELEYYKKMKEREALLLFGDISATVREAMEELDAELSLYLAESKGDAVKKEKTGLPAKKTMMQTFFGDFYSSGRPAKAQPKKKHDGLSKEDRFQISNFKKFKGGLHAVHHAWNCYHTFKKHHKLISW